MIAVVTNCDDCPLLAESVYCLHPDRPKGKSAVYEDNDNAPPNVWHPSWCPLRGNKLIIELVEP